MTGAMPCSKVTGLLPCTVSTHGFCLKINNRPFSKETTSSVALPPKVPLLLTILRDNIMAFIAVIGNIEVLLKRVNDGKQHTRGPTLRSKVNQRGNINSQNVIMWHAHKFLKCFEMKAKSINDLMSKYLQSRRVSRRGKKALEVYFHSVSPSAAQEEHLLMSQQHPSSLGPSSAKSHGGTHFIPDTCSGIHTSGPPASMQPCTIQRRMSCEQI